MGGLAPNAKLGRGADSRSLVSSGIQSHPKGSGSALPSIAETNKPGARGEGNGFPNVSGKGGGQLVNRAQGASANQQYWNNWSKQNQSKLADFQANRTKDWNNIDNFRNTQNVAASFNKPEWNNYKNNVQNFRNNRAIEINNNIQNNFDKKTERVAWKIGSR